MPPEQWDSPSFVEWIYSVDDNKRKLLKISASLFDERGRLVPMTQESWTDGSVSLADLPEPDIPKDQLDDIPF